MDVIGLGVLTCWVLVPSCQNFNVFRFVNGNSIVENVTGISRQALCIVNKFILYEWGSTIACNGARMSLIDCVKYFIGFYNGCVYI